MPDVEIQQLARLWAQEDPDPDTRAELQGLLDRGDIAGVEDRFGTTLEFGTAGIRGALGAGPNRMNRAMVRRITRGLALRLLQVPDAGDRLVLVGRDARHKSAEFLEDTVAVLAGAGLRVGVFPGVVPTPLLAWACREKDALAGVMITASHNPPSDNGYKVYADGGSQILTPLDEEIAEKIAGVGALSEIPLAGPGDPRIVALEPRLVEDYLRTIAAVCGDGPPAGAADMRIVYTPLHGVAGETCMRALRDQGFVDVEVVATQARPDPDFPTVVFPNPEEPGAMDEAIALARETAADLILANDPDGDRIAVGVREDPADPDGGWRMLTGDEVGCLLAEDLLATGRMTRPGTRPAVATTVVSSALLRSIAASHDALHVETLTGFKWLSAVAAAREDHTVVLAYEQALGVSVGDLVRDKDGISGALAVADLAARLRAEGRTLLDALDDLDRRHGAHVTGGRSIPMDDDELVDIALNRLRGAPPAELDGSPVIELWDHDAGIVTAADGALEVIDLPPTPLIRLVAADGSRVMVRPSGTEPKLKLYAEAVVTAPPADTMRDRAEARAETLLDLLSTVIDG